MKKDDIQIGQAYRAKVSDRLTTVRIDAEHPNIGWRATNLATGKSIHVKCPQRLRGPALGISADAVTAKMPVKKMLTKKEPAARRANLKAQHKVDHENARLRGERDASDDGMTASERAMAESSKDAKQAKPCTAKKREGLSCLDAAAKVLTETGEPMNAKAIIDAMAAKGYWTSDAPTPWATFYSALLREMRKRGDDARFTKVDRGKFALAGNATSNQKEG